MNWQQFWQRKSLGNLLLLPLSALFYGVTKCRYFLYQQGIFSAKKAALPIVVVGNINVGGAGKTPLVIALGQYLEGIGIHYAVISKGYGGNYQHLTVVESDSAASVVGDEPLLIKLKCDCLVVVAQSRIEAANYVAEHFPEVQIILTDDGLQHYKLQRDVEICVVKDKVGLGNGWVLPAGGLREPPSRLNSVNFVVHNGNPDEKYHYLLADRGWYHIHNKEQRYPDEFSTDENDNLALSGIAHPALFFQRLAEQGIAAKTQAFADHYALNQDELPADKTLLMTEKDWVKAKAFSHDDAWFLAVEAILSEPLKKDFLNKIEPLIKHKNKK